jgi:hypothetical protein
MNTNSAGRKLSVDWAEEVLFLLPLAARPYTETRLVAAPITVEFVERAAESKDHLTHTGKTEFFHREVPPAKAA